MAEWRNGPSNAPERNPDRLAGIRAASSRGWHAKPVERRAVEFGPAVQVQVQEPAQVRLIVGGASWPPRSPVALNHFRLEFRNATRAARWSGDSPPAAGTHCVRFRALRLVKL